MNTTTLQSFQRFFDIIKKLRGPDGCPWDKEQTAETLRPNILEEAYECIDAITDENNEHIQEELGDLFLLATMVSYIKEQEKAFSVSDVLNTIAEKLIRRHPHVFDNAHVQDSNDVIRQWNEIKEEEKGETREESILDKASRSFPPLERALLLQKEAGKVGFDWEHIDDVWKKVDEEMDELKEACYSNDRNGIEEELGDIFFALVNIARFLDVDPMIALHGANKKFYSRFNAIEKAAKNEGKPLESMTLGEMDTIWNNQKTKK